MNYYSYSVFAVKELLKEPAVQTMVARRSVYWIVQSHDLGQQQYLRAQDSAPTVQAAHCPHRAS